MADDTNDRLRVNVHEPHQVHYWTKRFSCTANELEAAVREVGVVASVVEQRLMSRKSR